MIAVRQREITVVITSCLLPNSDCFYGLSSELTQISSENRYLQTIETIRSLVEQRCHTIYLLDNSVKPLPVEWICAIENMGVVFWSFPAKINTKNKGISEIELLLNFCKLVKCKSPVLKISGRYTLNSDELLTMNSTTLIGRVFHRRRGFSEFTTKAYIVNNTQILESILNKSAKLTHTLIYRFWTPFLFLRLLTFIKDIVFKRQRGLFLDPPISIEEAFYHAILELKIDHRFVDNLGISGIAASEAMRVYE